VTPLLLGGRRRRRALRRAAGSTLILLVSALVLLSYAEIGINIYDEGIPYSGAERLARGERIYRDFHAYQPLRYWIFRAAMALGGPNLLSGRRIMALLGALQPWAAFASARLLGGSPATALLAAALALLVPSAYYVRFFPLGIILNLLALLRALERPRPRRWFLCGAMIALAFLAKLEVGLLALLIDLGALAVLLLSRSAGPPPLRGRAAAILRPAGALLLLPTLTIAAWAAYLAREVGLTHWLRYTGFQFVALPRYWRNPLPVPWQGAGLDPAGLELLARGVWYWIPGITLLLLLLLPERRALRRQQLGALAAYLLAAYALVLWRAGWGNLSRALGPTLVALPLLLQRFARGCTSNPKRPPLRRAANLLAATALATALVALAAIQIFREDEATGALGALRTRPLTTLETPRAAGIRCHPLEAATVDHVVQTVQSLLPPREPLLVLPYMPLFYFLCERPNPTPYEWIIPGTFTSPAEEAAALERYRRRPARALIYLDLAIDGVEERRFRRYAPLWQTFIEQHYRVLSAFNSILVMFYSPEPVELDLVSALYLDPDCWFEGRLDIESSLELDPPVRWLEMAPGARLLKLAPPTGILTMTAQPVPSAGAGRTAGLRVELLDEQGGAVLWESDLPPRPAEIRVPIPPAPPTATLVIRECSGDSGLLLAEPAILPAP
jgi:hypothetical protein